jgi:predicted negative regulator of RcsB-dependent stress response
MAVYDLEEQEKLDALKAWWARQGNRVTGVVAAVAIAAAGAQGYRYWNASQAQKASEAYAQLQKAVRDNDAKKVREIAGQITENFASSGYAAIAALISAKASIEAGDLKSAATQLKWVIDKTNDEEIRATARLRLAGVLLDEKNYDGALAQLNETHPEPFNALYADARGDILVAQGKRAEARGAYKAAIEKLAEDDPYRPVVQIKLDDLGVTP